MAIIYSNVSVFIKIVLAVTCAALVILWPHWRDELQAFHYGEPPIALFTFSPTNPVVDETITFDASFSFDPDGEIRRWEWDFGDGNTTEGEIVVHTYDQAGDFLVQLLIIDDDGFIDIASQFVPVETAILGFVNGSVSVSSGLTIFGASVSAEPGMFNTQTESDGTYSIPIPPGTYVITASADGYSSDSQDNVEVIAGETITVDLSLGSPLIASVGIKGNGLFRFLGGILQTTIGEILEILQKGGRTLWQGIIAAFDIKKGTSVGNMMKDPSFWADFYDDIYFKKGTPQARSRIDDCVSGIFGAGKSWDDLSEEEKMDEDLQLCLISSKSYPSGTIAPEFIKQWLE